MKFKQLVIFFGLVSSLTIQSVGLAQATARTSTATPTYRVLIDPGHGGIDGGTSRGTVLEKNLVLDIGMMTQQTLQKQGLIVKMTREEDTDLSSRYLSDLKGRHRRDLQNRLTMIREEAPDLFVSIHVNSSTQPGDRGPLVFYSATSDQGKVLAEVVQAALNHVAGSTQRPVGRKNLFLLRHATCPAVLAEMGFVTNDSDRQRLADRAYREKLAHALALAIITYTAKSREIG